MSSSFKTIAEDTICTYENPDNGSGPMWCNGSSTIVRDGSRVFAAVPETGKDVPPLCNTRWQLFCREDGGAWERANVNRDFNEREPCPLLRLPGGRIVLSVNPAVALRHRGEDGREGWDCEPRLLEFSAGDPAQDPAVIRPVWDQDYAFTAHSYRGVCADGQTGEVLLLNILLYEGQAWSFRDASGEWTARGMLRFPLRGCYPQVALKGRATHVMAVSDIVEPNREWREFKRKVTGQDWDFDFRQIYYAYTPDIAEEDFSPILTISSRDETAGHTRNEDLWIGPDGDAHLIYRDKNVWYPFMRDRFFPGMPLTIALRYCRVHEGKVIERRTLVECEEDRSATRPYDEDENDRRLLSEFPSEQLQPDWAMFHATPEDELYVIYHLGGLGADSPQASGNYILKLYPEAGEAPQKLDLKFPLVTFFTAGVRTGTLPSHTVDLYGLGHEPGTVRYAQIRIG